jgi:hypothetical protein
MRFGRRCGNGSFYLILEFEYLYFYQSFTPYFVKMTTETITLTKTSPAFPRFKGMLGRNVKYVVMLDGEPIFEVNPVREVVADEDAYEVETPADREAYERAMKDYQNGVNFSTLDFNKVKTLEDFTAFLENDE